MSILRRSAAVLSLLLFSGCRDYDSLAPLGPPGAGLIDERLLGDWRCTAAEDDEPALLSFRQFDATQYALLAADDVAGREPSVFRAYSSTIAEATFLNVQELMEASLAERGYTFLQYVLDDDGSLELQGVAPELFEAAEQAGQPPASVLAAALDDSESLRPLLKCVRRDEG
jgi:hypothetical protein